ncbi:nonribosomal peptide synthetase 6 [Polychaeton citri CBS 116435]|uniref:Nonribosomal peptide synthetase 6 n=1 Tax=Polychaeton citri CBS 116435 TaxID=1314669 RepID=A0A9P4Q0F5_9PEZI|nr:nonribosomal peptide synthetase 6 [Polychaeton citri CBS 116435]
MSSNKNVVSVLASIDPCHLPSLVYDHVASPSIGTYSSWISLPSKLTEDATSQLSDAHELYKLGFALLLKAYLRSDSVSFGLLINSRSGTRGVSATSEAQLLKASLDGLLPLIDNIQRLVHVPLGALERKSIGTMIREAEFEIGFKPFNTTLCLTDSSPDEGSIENIFGSKLVFRIDSDLPEATSYDKARVTLDYSTDLLDEWSAQNVIATFESILSTIATNANRRLDGLDLISSRDRKLINEWNANLPPAANQTLNEHFEKTFHDNVDKTVVYTSNGCFTYGELDDFSTVLALRLVKLGLKPNMVVPICMNKSRWVTVAMTAIWKAGGALTAMDPTHPDARLFAIIEELDAKIIISDAAHVSRFENAGIHLVSGIESLPRFPEPEDCPSSRAEAWHMGGVKPDDLAFVAFTSGSSGKPKGVMHTHNRLTSEHLSYIWNVEYGGDARILQFASYAYIAGVGENFRTMLHGTTLCVASETERTSDLAGFIARSGATRSYMTPSLIRTLNPKDIPSLKNLVVGGEPIDRDLEGIWAGHVHFIHLYGASEGGFMIKESRSDAHLQGKGVLPIGGLSWLVDPQDVDKLVPIGAAGEIIFESHELAAGYLNDPVKTSKTFIQPPTWARSRAAATGCRYLRMGDLGRYERDGSMTILGRADTQVKIHGQRIELQDIEYNLRNLLPPGSDAVVELVKPFDAPDRPILVAFCRLEQEDIPSGRSGTTHDDLSVVSGARKELEKALPSHMIPKAFLTVEQLPYNSSGKTDRKSLREDATKLGSEYLLATSLGTRDEHQERPATEKERIIAELWANILHREVESIGRRDSFLALGGDSLAAIRLVSAARLRKLELTTVNVLRHPVLQNIAELANISQVNPGVLAPSADCVSSLSNGTVHLKATDFQEWAVLEGALSGGWIDHLAYDFSGRVDLEILEESCKRLVQAHPILRAVFVLEGDQIHLDIPPEQKLTFEVHQAALDELEDMSRRIYAKDRISPLGRPIVRFNLIKVSPIRCRLIMRLSHAQYDGFCAAIFGEHLRLLYFSRPLPHTLPFHEYVSRIQEHDAIHNAELYWQGYLKGSSIPTLVNRKKAGLPFDNTLDGEIVRSVAEPNLQTFEVNTSALVKAAWALTISTLSQSNDVVFGDFIAGRQGDIPGIETVVGPCVNFTPVRVRMFSELTGLELVKQVQADSISAIPYESLGFKHIFRNCTEWGPQVRFSSIVNFINVEATSFRTEVWQHGDVHERLEVQSIYEEQQHDKTDLWLLCLPGHLASENNAETESGKTLELHFRYSKRLYQARTIDKIASLYCEALESLAASLDRPISIPQISDEEGPLLIPDLN